MKKQLLYFLISLLVSAAILGYLFSHVSLSEVLITIRDSYLPAVAMFLVFSFAMSVFRTWRYLLLLRVSGYQPPLIPMYLVVLVRNLCSDLLPARTGTLAYVALVTTRLGIPLEAAVSSWAFSFVFDLLAVAPLVVIAALFAGGAAQLSPWVLLGGGLLLGLLFTLLILFLPQLFHWSRVYLLQSKPVEALLSPSLRDWLHQKAAHTEAEVRKTQAQGIFMRLLLLSMLVRVCKYAGLYVFLYALLQPMGYSLDQLDIAKVFLGICAAELSASLPISGLGGFGLYQGTWMFVFELLGFPAQVARMTSLAHHIFTQAYGYSLGALALALLWLPFFKTEAREPRTLPISSGPSFYAKVCFVCALVSVSIAGLLYIPVQAQQAKPQASDVASDSELAARATLAGRFPGEIVFDSNRSGSFGIYRMRVDGSRLQVLADSAAQEMYPYPSVDGRWVVYARALSNQRTAPSEVWRVRTNGGKPERLLEDASFPSISADGKTVYVQRGRKAVAALDLETRKVRRLFPKPEHKFGSYQVLMPSVSADGKRIVFTSDKGGTWNTWMVDLQSGALQHLRHGCEVSWWPGSNKDLLWVSTNAARAGSGIYGFELGSAATRELVDRDNPRGHEYFPAVSTDGKYVLFSACSQGQHSHVDSDYQLFAKDLHSQEVVRLSFDGFTNRWPRQLILALEE